jgi:hypothetical protein
LRGQTDGRQHADRQDHATVTGPLRHSRVLPCRGEEYSQNGVGLQ